MLRGSVAAPRDQGHARGQTGVRSHYTLMRCELILTLYIVGHAVGLLDGAPDTSPPYIFQLITEFNREQVLSPR